MLGLMIFGCGGSPGAGGYAGNTEISSGLLSFPPGGPGAEAERGTGSISGIVHRSLLSDASCTGGNAVYLFDGHNADPDDIDGITADPVDYVIVKFDSTLGQYQYKITGLTAGDYTVAFTCQASADNPDVDNFIVFQSVRDVTVVPGRNIIQHMFRSGS